MAAAVWRFIVRPIAVGGMLVGAAYTLFKMRASLTAGLGKAFADLRQTADDRAKLSRTRAVHELEGGIWTDCVDVCAAMCVLYVHISRTGLAGDSGRGGDAPGGIFLRHGLRKSGGLHRIVEQSDFRVDAFHSSDRGAC